MWGPTIAEQYLATYGTSTAIADGKLYECYMSGIVYCFDIKTATTLDIQRSRPPQRSLMGNKLASAYPIRSRWQAIPL